MKKAGWKFVNKKSGGEMATIKGVYEVLKKKNKKMVKKLECLEKALLKCLKRKNNQQLKKFQ